MENKCETCNGTGQVSYFQGESRFLLTHEECPDCHGTGIDNPTDPEANQPTETDGSK